MRLGWLLLTLLTACACPSSSHLDGSIDSGAGDNESDGGSDDGGRDAGICRYVLRSVIGPRGGGLVGVSAHGARLAGWVPKDGGLLLPAVWFDGGLELVTYPGQFDGQLADVTDEGIVVGTQRLVGQGLTGFRQWPDGGREFFTLTRFMRMHEDGDAVGQQNGAAVLVATDGGVTNFGPGYALNINEKKEISLSRLDKPAIGYPDGGVQVIELSATRASLSAISDELLAGFVDSAGGRASLFQLDAGSYLPLSEFPSEVNGVTRGDILVGGYSPDLDSSKVRAVAWFRDGGEIPVVAPPEVLALRFTDVSLNGVAVCRCVLDAGTYGCVFDLVDCP